MQLKQPQLSTQLEDSISLDEALAMAQGMDEPLCDYAFYGQSIAGNVIDAWECKGCYFKNCRFTGAVLRSAWLKNCVFEQCDFSGANLMESTIQQCKFIACKLAGANISASVLEQVSIDRCVAQGANFTECYYKHVSFTQSNLQQASFSALHARSVFAFSQCDLCKADFVHTALKGQDLRENQIEGAVFSGTELRGAIVTGLQACELARLLGVEIR